MPDKHPHLAARLLKWQRQPAMRSLGWSGTGPHHGDAAHHRLIGDVDQPPRLDRDTLADKKHPARVAVPAIEDHGDVDIEDVALHQPPVARDAVTDDMVDRGADRFREA